MALYNRHEDGDAVTYTITPADDECGHASMIKVFKDSTGHYEANFCECRDSRTWQEITDAIEDEASGLWVNV